MAVQHLIAAPAISGSEKGLVVGIGVIAILALVFAGSLVREVLKADKGTAKMQEIAKAVQEGARAYLNRQFRTLAVFSVIVFVLLLFLPVNHGGFSVQLGRALFFIVDLGSTNGTLVNGEPVQEKELKHGDRITIGQNAVSFNLL
jgi:K(+)-stimulated pyrophosphate-energized sodium pump